MSRVLVSGGGAAIGKALAAELGKVSGSSVYEINATGAACHDYEHLLQRVDEVIHVVTFGREELVANWLDYATRVTYDLLLAASQAEVKQVTLVSTMELFEGYPAHMVVGPIWAPMPTAAPGMLGPFLAEFIAKQFARAGLLRVLVARIGALADSGRLFQTEVSAAAEQIVSELRQSERWLHPFPPNVLRWRVIHVHDNVKVPATSPASASESLPQSSSMYAEQSRKTRVLLLGANGFLGPHLINALGPDRYEVIATDKPEGRGHEPAAATIWREQVLAASGGVKGTVLPIDIGDADAVEKLAKEADVIVNCACARNDRRLAWRANCQGTFNAVRAAIKHRHRRFVNTGPMFTVTGPDYEDYDDMITEDVPPHPGIGLYAVSKACGHLISQVLAKETNDLHVINCLFREFFNPEPSDERRFDGSGAPGGDTSTMSISWGDAASLLRSCLEVDLSRLPSRCEVFFGHANTPHQRYSNAKTQRILQWAPRDNLSGYWTRTDVGHRALPEDMDQAEQQSRKKLRTG